MRLGSYHYTPEDNSNKTLNGSMLALSPLTEIQTSSVI